MVESLSVNRDLHNVFDKSNDNCNPTGGYHDLKIDSAVKITGNGGSVVATGRDKNGKQSATPKNCVDVGGTQRVCRAIFPHHQFPPPYACHPHRGRLALRLRGKHRRRELGSLVNAGSGPDSFVVLPDEYHTLCCASLCRFKKFLVALAVLRR